MSKILIIDDEIEICQLLDRFLTRKGFKVSTTLSANDGLRELKGGSFDLIISDFRLPDRSGLELLKDIKGLDPNAKVIIMTGYSDIRMAVEVIKFGAYDYISKPLFPEELFNLINQALDAGPENTPKQVNAGNAEKKSATQPSVKSDTSEYLVGISPNGKDVFKNLSIVAPTGLSVMLFGETGTGKEYVAKEIHRLSARAEKPFIAIDCGALPKDIAASEFFGHEKGSFTGALNSRDGKFKLADGGTLFLDEIGNLSYEVQLKLLRVLQEQKFTRVGGSNDISVDVRIIAATNENLKESMESGEFREDLFYRLNEFNITLGSLRNRREDIPLFIDRFVIYANAQLDKKIQGFDDEAMDKLLKYQWPGNLRELRNIVKRSVLMASGDMISMDVLPEEIVYNQQGGSAHSPDSLKEAAHHAERERIIDVLNKTGNNKSLAARILDIDRKTLYNKLRSFDL